MNRRAELEKALKGIDISVVNPLIVLLLLILKNLIYDKGCDIY